MATFEQMRMAEQVQRVMENLRRDMRANAQAYLTAVLNAKPIAQIASVAGQNTAQYQLLLDKIKAVNDSAPRTANVTAGLLAKGLSYADVVTYFLELRAAANAEAAAEAAGLTTGAKINTMANATLANVAGWDSLW